MPFFFIHFPPPPPKKTSFSHCHFEVLRSEKLLRRDGSPDLNLPAENPCHRNFAQSPDVTNREPWGDDSVKLSGMKNRHGSIRTTSNKGPHINWRKTWQYLRCILVPKIPKILIDSEDLYRTTKIRMIRMNRFPLDWHSGETAGQVQKLSGLLPPFTWQPATVNHPNSPAKLFSNFNRSQAYMLLIGFLWGVVIPLIFPEVPQSSLGILKVPQLPPPLGPC